LLPHHRRIGIAAIKTFILAAPPTSASAGTAQIGKIVIVVIVIAAAHARLLRA
jgi:hypothetical protein